MRGNTARRKGCSSSSSSSEHATSSVVTAVNHAAHASGRSSKSFVPTWMRVCAAGLVLLMASSGWLYAILQDAAGGGDSFAAEQHSFLRTAASWKVQIIARTTAAAAAPLAEWKEFPRVLEASGASLGFASRDVVLPVVIPLPTPESSEEGDSTKHKKNKKQTISSVSSNAHNHDGRRHIKDNESHNLLFVHKERIRRYRYPDRIGGDDEDCHPADDWQTAHHPTCSSIHEVDLTNNPYFVAAGGYRRVFKIIDSDGTPRVLKTLNVPLAENEHGTFDLRNADRHRRDAIAFEQLTHSSRVVDMFQYCSNSAVFNFGDGGDLARLFRNKKIDPTETYLMELAYNVSMSLHDAHHIHPVNGLATMAHTDVKPDQWLFEGGYYKLTDFNRVRFLGHKENKDGNTEVCTFTVGRNAGMWRAPEEYSYDGETNAVDVYSLGNMIHYIMSKEKAWYPEMDRHGWTDEEMYPHVQKGEWPELPQEYQRKVKEEPDNIFVQTLYKARNMAFTLDQHKRPTAKQVADVILEGLNALKNQNK